MEKHEDSAVSINIPNLSHKRAGQKGPFVCMTQGGNQRRLFELKATPNHFGTSVTHSWHNGVVWLVGLSSEYSSVQQHL